MSATTRAVNARALPLPDLRALEIYTAVVEAGSMTAAAERLGLSQSGVSQSVKHLEAVLGVTIVDRSVRPPTVTEAGQDLYARARRILAEVGETAHAVRRAAHVGGTRLRMGLVDSFAGSVAPALAYHLRETSGGCQLVSGQSAMLAGALRRRELDLVVSSDDSLFAQPGLSAQPLVCEPMILALPRAYAPKNASLARVVADLDLVSYTEHAAMGRQIGLHLNRLRLTPRSRLAFDSSDAVLGMVAAGLGFAVTTPLCLLQGRGRLPDVYLQPLPGPALYRHLSIGRHEGELAELSNDIACFSAQALKRDALPAIRQIAGWMAKGLQIAEPEFSRTC